MTTTAKTSLISNKSTSDTVHPGKRWQPQRAAVAAGGGMLLRPREATGSRRILAELAHRTTRVAGIVQAISHQVIDKDSTTHLVATSGGGTPMNWPIGVRTADEMTTSSPWAVVMNVPGH